MNEPVLLSKPEYERKNAATRDQRAVLLAR